ncbi:MAG: DNA repair protein RecO [Candidatus Nanopelagicales bacterium]|nr:DNA repair protein RecO [Candidatus Nanopelagicales bacterium]
MPVYRDEAIVLRAQKLGESDRIVTLLTRQYGRIRAVARGVRKTSSRIGGRLEPFAHVDLQLYTGKSLDNITQVETIAALGGPLAADYVAWTSGTAMLEAAERLTPEEREPAVPQFALLVSGLRSLSSAEHDPRLILDSYLLRSLAVAGWSPSFGDCAQCGVPGPHRAFSIAMGGMVCERCRQPGAAAPSPQAVALLGALLSGDWSVADVSDLRTRGEASGMVSAFLQWHVDRGLKSLPLVDRKTPPTVKAIPT